MKQPQLLQAVGQQTLQQMSNLSTTPTTSLTKPEQEKTLTILSKFGDRDQFLQRVNPKTQASFAQKKEKAIMGDYPTLTDICQAYGKTFSFQWLCPQIVDLSKFTGAKNLDKEQVEGLASIIAAEYRYLKVTELLLFFYFFKTGRYGRFYGSVDPMVITCALRDFIKERNVFIDQYERDQHNLQYELNKRNTMTHEQWLEYKKLHSLENKNEQE